MGWRGRSTTRITRDSILFVVGLAGIIYETLVTGGDRPTLLILFAGMVGLPAFLRTDEKQSDKTPSQKVAEEIAKEQRDGDES